VEEFAAAARLAVERTVKELQELRRASRSRYDFARVTLFRSGDCVRSFGDSGRETRVARLSCAIIGPRSNTAPQRRDR
jgi:hypothetical protein